MSKYGRDVDAIYRDILIALAHPDYADTPTCSNCRGKRTEPVSR